jgi:glutamate-1-semialdehyde 2,1-aminomutase
MQTTITSRPKTESVYKKLCQLIPGGVNSPVRACIAVGQTPLVAESAHGDMIVDVDGNQYIDYCGSWGPLIHGHAHPEISAVLQEQILKGTTYGVTTELEGKLAEKVMELMPSIEQIRFVSSGTEATMSAIRLARGYTGRDLIIKFSGNYHGHADFLLVKAGSGVMNIAGSSSKGIPEGLIKNTLCLPFNCVESIKAVFNNPEFHGKIACVIVEPVAGNMGVVPGTQAFIQTLREETDKHGTVLIFDEVMCGFRVAKGGAGSIYNVVPDMTCLGKIVGGGLPAAAFGGKFEIMQNLAPIGPVYQAGTLSGNPLAMVAGLKALQMLDVDGFYEELDRKTDLLLKPIQDHIEKNELNCCIQRAGSMFTLFFGRKSVRNAEEMATLDFEKFGKFFRTLFQQEIYGSPLQQEPWFISMAHTYEHLKETAEKVILALS